MSVLNIIKRIFVWWDGQTLGTQLFTWRTGERVGADEHGNVYYRNADDSKRWVIYNGEVEGSRVAPDWHGWLHRTWDELPDEKPLVHKDWEKPHLPNLTGTPQAYAPKGSIRRAEPMPRSDYEAWTPE
ncbi:MAG: NADH:ubiquinone oxidoreductase subunit NDUFA12 [Salibaculum sp.]|jgi:NADH:ubiquinone oxidoreductase subunit|uniref:NADH:ubiquinone oxidoreductase subunit NDUFA12 n=1 Tax=Roseovarius halophilus (ex Wu et al. 2025) TaxID=3376060 RepID=UPI002870AC15|nr:NADH:ubiquinone oxidoreductase subunit NDUFA12 [Salibaculum sp.]MDR9428740.1 NADH:ubiquinone oxidoreductase subunit NDUFA12 [Salibaculum sp.]MDR9483219.1 NADH:ubiquinone oxidoreductase subunit NDUFA12 [Salibaculum sp.]